LPRRSGPRGSCLSASSPLIFEFSHFHKTEYEHGREFIDALDDFLSRIPKGWQYTVEIRNKTFLHPDYFAVLREHGVAGRFLLTPGRKYDAAVKAFEPYQETRAIDEDARNGLAEILKIMQRRPRGGYVYVNNRLEGNAINTIAAGISKLTGVSPTIALRPSPVTENTQGELL
jgi:hypothetical protein